MCAWVMTICFSVSRSRRRMSRMSSIWSPGSITMASRVCSSPMIEQLHCRGPTGRILWIMFSEIPNSELVEGGGNPTFFQDGSPHENCIVRGIKRLPVAPGDYCLDRGPSHAFGISAKSYFFAGALCGVFTLSMMDSGWLLVAKMVRAMEVSMKIMAHAVVALERTVAV